MTSLRAVAVGASLLGTAAAQLVTTDAGVQSPALVSVKERVEWIERAEAREFRATTSFGWSPERRLQLDLVVPLATREVDGTPPLTQRGFGDVVLAAKWALVRDDDVMRSDRLSILGDVAFDTGDDEALTQGHHAGVTTTARSAIGLGTWGGSLGLGGTIVRDRHRAAVAARWHLAAANDGFDPGSAASLDVAWWYRLTPVVFAPDHHGIEVRGVLELLSRWQGDDAVNGVGVANGGFDATLVAGAQVFLDPATGVEFGVKVPLESTTDSPLGHERITVFVGLRWIF